MKYGKLFSYKLESEDKNKKLERKIIDKISTKYDFCKIPSDLIFDEIKDKNKALELHQQILWNNNQKTCYSFYDVFFDEIIDTELDVKIPNELFDKMKNKGIFFETIDRDLKAFVSPDINLLTNENFIRFEIYIGATVHKGAFYLINDTIENSADYFLQTYQIELDSDQLIFYHELCSTIAKVLVYIFSKNADIARINYKKRNIYIEHIVGSSYIKFLNNLNNKSSDHHKIKAHIRKAHYHKYWIKKNGNKKVIYKWIPPIFVNKTWRNKND